MCCAREEKHLTVVFDKTEEILENNGMKLNKDKIKVILHNNLDSGLVYYLNTRLNTNIDREPVVQVKNYFSYICSKITEKDRSELNIISKIAQKKRVFQI